MPSGLAQDSLHAEISDGRDRLKVVLFARFNIAANSRSVASFKPFSAVAATFCVLTQKREVSQILTFFGAARPSNNTGNVSASMLGPVVGSGRTQSTTSRRSTPKI